MYIGAFVQSRHQNLFPDAKFSFNAVINHICVPLLDPVLSFSPIEFFSLRLLSSPLPDPAMSTPPAPAAPPLPPTLAHP